MNIFTVVSTRSCILRRP